MKPDLIERLKQSLNFIGAMCKEGRPPKMSIPARPDHDEDLIMAAAIKEAIAALEAMQADSTASAELIRRMLENAEKRNARIAELEAMIVQPPSEDKV